MDINDKVNANIAETKQAIDSMIAPITQSGETIMPESLEVIISNALKKFNISKTNILEDWMEVLGKPKGLASEFGELKVLHDALSALPELNRLENEMKDKEQKMQEAWREYSIRSDEPTPNHNNGRHQSPHLARMTRGQVS
jgi:hypothetical protein